MAVFFYFFIVSYIFWNNANHLISEPQEPRLRLVGWELWKRFGAVHPVGADESSEGWEAFAQNESM